MGQICLQRDLGFFNACGIVKPQYIIGGFSNDENTSISRELFMGRRDGS